MNDNVEVLPLFAFPLHPYDFELTKEQEKVIVDVANKVDYKVLKSGNNPSKSKKIFNENPELHFLEQMLLKEFYRFKNVVLRYEDLDFRITTSWFTKTKPGGNCQYHNHNNSMYSGVFYFNNDEEHTKINFTYFGASTSYLLVKPTSYNLYNSTSWSLPQKNNSCIYFPSHLPHAVDTNTSDKIRQSLAFNFMPIGTVGVGDSTYDYGGY